MYQRDSFDNFPSYIFFFFSDTTLDSVRHSNDLILYKSVHIFLYHSNNIQGTHSRFRRFFSNRKLSVTRYILFSNLKIFFCFLLFVLIHSSDRCLFCFLHFIHKVLNTIRWDVFIFYASGVYTVGLGLSYYMRDV